MRTFSFCGTIEYMSPELIKGGNEGHDFSVDWWSVGVLTYELLTGASPFTVDGERNTQAEISKRILRNQPPIPDYLTPEASDFIRRLLVKEPIQRLGGGQSDANQLKQHPFLSKINWSLLAQRKLKPPFKPKIKHELDVSNFAEEFTSMAPHALVASSNNHINGASIATSADDLDNEDDDYYESDDEEEDCNNERDDKFTEAIIGQSNCLRSFTSETNAININKNHRSIDNMMICGPLEKESNSPKSAIGFWPLHTINMAQQPSQQLILNDLNLKLMPSSFEHQTYQYKTQKASLSSLSYGNDSVIQSNESSSGSGSRYSGLSNISVTSQAGSSCGQQIFSMLSPSKNQLSFSLLARQNHILEANSRIIDQQKRLLSSLSNSITRSNNQNNGSLSEGNTNRLNILANNSSKRVDNNQALYDQLQYQQSNNRVHYSKLFKGYSYINPDEVEWLKQQDKNLLKIRDGKSPSTKKYNDKFQDDNLSSLKKTIFKGKVDPKTHAAKALPVENIILLDHEDEEKLFGDNQGSARAIFTIGDGQDLSSAVRSASRSQPERLIVVKRKPSLEVLYEHHTNNQLFGLDAIKNDKTRTDDSDKKYIIDKTQKPRELKAPRLGSILFDPQCEFFKYYYLPNAINSKKDLLGVGAYSICKRCINKETGKEYALKLMDRSNPTNDREIDILTKCQGHPNIVRLYNVYHDQFNTYLVFELLKGGELLSRIRKPSPPSNSTCVSLSSSHKKRQLINESDICKLFKSIASTVNYLHSLRIVHRDLKPENLLFVDLNNSNSSELKLIDFGFARKLPEPNDQQSIMNSPCSTLGYCAPEVLNQCFRDGKGKRIELFNDIDAKITNDEVSSDGYDESCDLWSLGVILYAMLSGQLPFKKTEFPKELSDYVKKMPLNSINSDKGEHDSTNSNDVARRSKLLFHDDIWNSVSQAAKDVIIGLLTPDPKKRMTIHQLMQHKWFQMIDLDERDKKHIEPPRGQKRKSSSSKPQVGPMTMTLRKRVAAASKFEEVIDEDAAPYHKRSIKRRSKRSLDNPAPSRSDNSRQKRQKLSADSNNTGGSRGGCSSTNANQSPPIDSSKWLSRFVQIGRTSKDNLRITFKALNSFQPTTRSPPSQILMESTDAGKFMNVVGSSSSVQEQASSCPFVPATATAVATNQLFCHAPATTQSGHFPAALFRVEW